MCASRIIRPWQDEDIALLLHLKEEQKYTWKEIGNRLERRADAVRSMYRRVRDNPNNYAYIDLKKFTLPESPYPTYEEPLVMEGDAVIIPDLEAPFHHAEFVNRVLEVAQTWGVKQCILAGDILHFDSISKWEANWVQPKKSGGALTVEQEHELRAFAMDLPKKYQERANEIIEVLGIVEVDRDVSTELAEARKALHCLADVFERIDYNLGNHDSRFLHALNSPMFPQELLNLLQLPDPKWRIAPYYFGYLHSGREVYRTEHPKSAAMNAARKLASKYHCHILMGHSHALRMEFDPSGKYWAVQLGHCVDEKRLAYAAQRSNTKDAHLLGAAIVRDGYLTVLHEKVDWERLTRM